VHSECDSIEMCCQQPFLISRNVPSTLQHVTLLVQGTSGTFNDAWIRHEVVPSPYSTLSDEETRNEVAGHHYITSVSQNQASSHFNRAPLQHAGSPRDNMNFSALNISYSTLSSDIGRQLHTDSLQQVHSLASPLSPVVLVWNCCTASIL
jgi:hypothetical protein